jgi:hypothetical protein
MAPLCAEFGISRKTGLASNIFGEAFGDHVLGGAVAIKTAS